MAICIQSANQKLGSGGTRLRHPILLFLVIFSVAKKNSGKRSFQQTETSQCLPYLDVPSFQLGSMMNGSNSRFFLTPNQKTPLLSTVGEITHIDPPTVMILQLYWSSFRLDVMKPTKLRFQSFIQRGTHDETESTRGGLVAGARTQGFTCVQQRSVGGLIPVGMWQRYQARFQTLDLKPPANWMVCKTIY